MGYLTAFLARDDVELLLLGHWRIDLSYIYIHIFLVVFVYALNG